MMPMTNPVISIITITKNSQKTLEYTIQSIIAQNSSFYEYIIIDGGSGDGTQDIIKKYENFFSYWVSEPDQGIYDAMTKGIKAAKGRWIYFLGSDDLLLPGIIEELKKYLISDDVIYYGNVLRQGFIKPYDGYFDAIKLTKENICQQAIFYPKKIFEKYSFNKKYRLWADYYLNIELFHDKNFKFEYIPLTIAKYGSSGLSSQNEDEIFIHERNAIFKKYFSFKVYLYFKIYSLILPFKEFACNIKKRIGVKDSGQSEEE